MCVQYHGGYLEYRLAQIAGQRNQKLFRVNITDPSIYLARHVFDLNQMSYNLLITHDI